MTDLSKLDFPFEVYETGDDEHIKFSASTRARADRIIKAVSGEYPHVNVRESFGTFVVDARKYVDTVLRGLDPGWKWR